MGLVVIPIYHEFQVTSLGLGICALGVGFYYVLVYPTHLPRSLTSANGMERANLNSILTIIPKIQLLHAHPKNHPNSTF